MECTGQKEGKEKHMTHSSGSTNVFQMNVMSQKVQQSSYGKSELVLSWLGQNKPQDCSGGRTEVYKMANVLRVLLNIEYCMSCFVYMQASVCLNLVAMSG